MTGGAPGPRHRGQPLGLGIGARGAGHVADLSQFTRHQVLRRFRHDAHRDVDLVAQQIVHAVLEQHVQHDVGIVALELQQPGRHDELAVAAGHAEPDLALRRLAQALHRLARGDQLVLDAAAVLVELQPDLGGFHAARAAPHQLHADRPLQLAQVVADIGAGHLEPARGLAQIARVQDLHQQGQGFASMSAYRRSIAFRCIVKFY